MREVKFYANCGFQGANHEETVEFPADATDEEIESSFRDWLFTVIAAGWYAVEEGEEDE